MSILIINAGDVQEVVDVVNLQTGVADQVTVQPKGRVKLLAGYNVVKNGAVRPMLHVSGTPVPDGHLSQSNKD